jgi:4-diphosphocytidyl-2-C-methyl-D-erythritol kinase
MHLLAPAKINLDLRVAPPRADGFHPLVTWMCTVALFDKLDLDRSTAAGPAPLSLSCDSPDVPADERNLVLKVANAFANELFTGSGERAPEGEDAGAVGSAGKVGETPPRRTAADWHVRLQKRIPVGAGLGGGSSDGARILSALNHLWNAGRTREQLADFSANFGSDLPFFLYGPSAICRGRGERVTAQPPPRTKNALLILPGVMMPTPAVYKMFDTMSLGDHAAIESEPDFNGWISLPAGQFMQRLRNDLEPAAFAIDPGLGRLRADVEQSLARVVRMSGSGSSLFTLFDEEAQASAAATRISERFPVRTLAVELCPKVQDDLNGA